MEENYTLEDALAFIEEEKFVEAKVILTKLLKNDFDNVDLWKNLGLCNVNLDLKEKAFLDFSQVIQLTPEDATSWFYLGSMADKLGNFSVAEQAYKKVIELRPNFLDAYKNLVVMYMLSKQSEKVDKYEEIIYELGSSDYQINYMLGTVFMATSRYEKAIRFFEKALEIKPDDPMILNNIGSSNLGSGNLDAAIVAFKKSCEIDDKNPVSFYNLSTAYKFKHNYEESYNAAQKAYELEPSSFYLVTMSSAALSAEKFEEAVRLLEILTSMEPENELYKFNLAVAYEGINDYKKAMEIFESINHSENTSFNSKLKIAELKVKINDYEGAKKIYLDLIKKGKANASMYYDFAIMCGYTGDKEKAEKLLKKVITLDPKFAIAHKDLAVLFLEARLFDYAKEEFEIAMSLEPENPYIVYEYGNYFQMTGDSEKADELYDVVLDSIYMPANILLNIAINKLRLRKNDEAQKVLERALKDESQNIDVLYNLGKIYFMNKQYENAKQLFEDAMFLEKNPEIESMLGQIYMAEENYQDAIGLFADIDKQFPTNTANLMNLTKCALKLDKKEDALGFLHRYTEIFPEDQEAISLLADLM